LDTGDHKSVLHLSYVFYANAKIFRASQIDKGLEIKFLFPKPDLAEAVFQRIEQGICVSPDTPPNVRKYHGC
jgi:hypothetical protein